MLEIRDDDLTLVKESLARQIPGHKVIAFGSRTNGRARKYSDLDLCVMSNPPPTERDIIRLKNELSEEPISIRVDVLVWTELSDSFRKIIENQTTVIVQE